MLFARDYARFDRVHLSTDSEDFAVHAERLGIAVPFFRSPAASSDEATTAHAVIETLDGYAERGETFDFVAILQPTTPYRRVDRWDEAFAATNDTEVDCVFSAMPVADHPWHCFTTRPDGSVAFFFDGAERSTRSQDLPPALRINGSLYLTRVSALRRENTLVTSRSRAVIMDDPAENIDIDTVADWDEAVMLCQKKLAA